MNRTRWLAVAGALTIVTVILAAHPLTLPAQSTSLHSPLVGWPGDARHRTYIEEDARSDMSLDAWTTTVDGLRTGLGAVTVIDVRSARDYRRGHVPGAVRVSWLDHRDGWGRTGKLPDDLGRVAQAMGSLGVDGARPVVVYGKARDGWGEEGRVAWMLHYLGHSRVTILDGGWPAWQRAGGPVSREVPAPRAGGFAARPRAAARASADDVASASAAGVLVLDTRSTEEWNGSRKYWPKRQGRIPGAVHLEWRELLTADGLLDRSPALRERLRRLGLTPERRVIAYCVGGVRSGQAFVALKALGFHDVRNYDGSFYEWAADGRRSVISGDANPRGAHLLPVHR